MEKIIFFYLFYVIIIITNIIITILFDFNKFYFEYLNWRNKYMWFQSMLRWLLGVIDGWIYTACAWLYDLMMDIASARVFSNETIQDVSMRVYQLLGLVMLFRLIFAF